MDIENGNATEHGAQMADTLPSEAVTEQTNPEAEQTPTEQTPRTVPYSRFAEVNNAKKAAETALADVVAALVEEIPEQYRQLVPDIAPAAKVAWIKQARATGLFAQQTAPTASPDAARPIQRPQVDLNTATPFAMMRGGYN